MSAKGKKGPALNSSSGNTSSGALPWNTLYLAVAFFTLLLYANTLSHDFTVDDGTVIKNNRFTVKGVDGLGDIFSHSYRAGFWDRKEGLYRPLSVAMFALEWELAPGNPLPGHVINILLYMLTAVLLLRLLRKLLIRLHPLIPVAVTLLWIAHPLHTEVVANIKSRDELLSFFLGILTLDLVLSYHRDRNILPLILSAGTYFMALLSKESSVTWAGVFPLALWCFTDMDLKTVVKRSALYVMLIGVFFLLRIAVIGEVAGGYELMLINNSLVEAPDTVSRLATAFFIMGKYLLLFIAPVNLVFDYSFNTIANVGFGNLLSLLSFLLLTGGLIYALIKLPGRSAVSFCVLFYLGTILLVSNIFFLIEATMAERFVFTPSLGLCMLTGILLERLIKPSQQKKDVITVKNIRSNSLFFPLVIVLVLFSGRTISRNADWKDNLTLLQHDVKLSPGSARIRYALGSTLLVEHALKAPEGSVERNNLLDRAITELTAGVTILPNYNDAWYHLGIAYKEKGDPKNAVKAFETARSYKEFTEASRLSSAGVAYGQNAQYDLAIRDLSAAVQLDKNDADIWNNYGLYLGESGRLNEAIAALNTALILKPGFDKALYNKGNAYAKAGDFRSALREYDAALQINPGYTDALNNSGNCYIMLQRPDSARSYFERSVQANPGNTKALINLIVTLQNLGDTTAARTYILKARALGVKI